jgi:hypothetical protein
MILDDGARVGYSASVTHILTVDSGGDLTNLVHDKYPQYLTGNAFSLPVVSNLPLNVQQTSAVFPRRPPPVSTTSTRGSRTAP